MTRKGLSFREILDAAAKLVPQLRNADGKVVLSAVARYCKAKGHPVSQPTLSRHYKGPTKDGHELDIKTAEALCAVFRIPTGVWRGEALGAQMDNALTKASLEDLLLAERIQRLPKKARDNILEQIEEILEREEKLKRAYAESNVTPIDRDRR